MGAPKQKWTSGEEAALKAGIAKYGVGKWSTILKDPEFSSVLYMRSNVDLKDKWRNINVMTSGWGSRQRARIAIKNNQPVTKHDNNSMALTTVVESKMEIFDAKPLAISGGTLENAGLKKPISSLDNLIVEAITKLKEPHGSNRTTIAAYIEEQYATPANFDKLLVANLMLLTEQKKLMKVKHQYRIAPSSMLVDARRNISPLVLEDKLKASLVSEKDIILTKAQVDADIEKMYNMTAEEVAAAAAQAVAEAEIAIAEAEKAAREAELAEENAQEAQAFAEAATKALKCRALRIWIN